VGKGKILERQANEIVPHAEVKLTESQCFLLQVEMVRFLETQAVAAILLKKAESYVLNHPILRTHYEQLNIIPGFNAVTVLTILTEVGDYSRFHTADAFSKFCGVVLQSNKVEHFVPRVILTDSRTNIYVLPSPKRQLSS